MPSDPPQSTPTWGPDANPPEADDGVADGAATWHPTDRAGLDAPDSLGTWAPDAIGPQPASGGAPSDDEQRYTDAGLLGRGGLAEVRSVHDARLGREIAVKRLQRTGSRVSRRRFLREARITAQLEHPNIVPIYDASVGPDGVPYYTMKYVRGTALSSALRDAPGLAARLELITPFTAVCQAMAYAHDRRVIHRDLKPDNIMLGEFGEALVVDWGLARALDDDDEITSEIPSPGVGRRLDIDPTALTVVGQVAGTPAYMPPEQARGESTTPASDVYALGAILYEILTGRPPHGLDGDIEAQLARARDGTFQAVHSVSPEAPIELVAITERALSIDPESRYAPATGLARELERWRSGRLVEAHTYTPLELLRRFARRYRAQLALGGLGLVAVLVVGGVGLVNTRAERDRAQRSEEAAVEAAARANRDLASLLADRAARAHDDGDHGGAQAYAAASLAIQDSPSARGTLASSWAEPTLTLAGHVRAPHPCRAVTLFDDDILCGGGGRLSRLTADGDIVWGQALPGDITAIAVRDGQLWVGAGDTLWRLDAATGDRRGSTEVDPDLHGLFVDSRGTAYWTERPRFDRTRARWPLGGEATRRAHSGSFIARTLEVDGALVTAHALGTIIRDGEVIADADHVLYDVVRTEDGWVVGGSRVTRLYDDGRSEALPELERALSALQLKGSILAGHTSDGALLVYDLRTRRTVGRLPDIGLPPRFALGDGQLLTTDGPQLTWWNVATPMHPEPGTSWPMVASRADGSLRLYCGLGGVAELYDLDARRVIPLRVSSPGPEGTGRLLVCTFRRGQPVAVWSRVRARWAADGELLSAGEGAKVAHIRWLGDVEVQRTGREVRAATAQGWRRLGTMDLDPTPTSGLLVFDDATWQVRRWVSTPGGDDLEEAEVSDLPADHLPLGRFPDGRWLVRRIVDDSLWFDHGPHRVRLPSAGAIASAWAIDDQRLVTGDRAGRMQMWTLGSPPVLTAASQAASATVTEIRRIGDGPDAYVEGVGFDGDLHHWALTPLLAEPDQLVDQVRRRTGLVARGGTLHTVTGAAAPEAAESPDG